MRVRDHARRLCPVEWRRPLGFLPELHAKQELTMRAPDRMTAMLSPQDTRRVAALLANQLGEVAIAAAVLHAQQAERRGELTLMVNWRRIAEQALRRFEPEYSAA
jgi:hypothetical protein